MRKSAYVVLAVAATLALAGGAWLYWHPNAATDAKTLTLYGDVDIREVQPAFNDSGHITAMLAQEGTRVKAGDLLATIDDTRYAAKLAQAKAQLENQRQGLDRLVAGSRPEEIAQAKAAMDGLDVTYRNSVSNFQRFQTLAPRGAATVQQRDDAKALAEATRQQFEAAKQTYILAVKGPRAEDIGAARGAARAAEAAVALAQREFDDTRLYARADGIIEDRILEIGDMASPATPVFTIALPSPLWVRTYVPESDLGRVRPGMEATVGTDSYPDRVYHGWIGYISPTAEFTPKTVETPELRTALVYQARVYVCDARDELRLGMPATVRIDLNAHPIAAPKGCGPADAAHP